MKYRGNQPMLRTFAVRALSFSAVVAFTLNPVLSPVVAADYRGAAPVAQAAPAVDGQMNARLIDAYFTGDITIPPADPEPFETPVTANVGEVEARHPVAPSGCGSGLVGQVPVERVLVGRTRKLKRDLDLVRIEAVEVLARQPLAAEEPRTPLPAVAPEPDELLDAP